MIRLSSSCAILLQENIIEKTGRTFGLRDIGLLESAL